MKIRMIPIQPKTTFGQDTKRAFAGLHQAIRDQAAVSVAFMTVYPPKSFSSTYVRTGTLRRSWLFRMVSGNRSIQGIVASQGNIAPYNEDVQGENQLPHFLQLGWRNVKQMVKLINRELPGRIERILGRSY